MRRGVVVRFYSEDRQRVLDGQVDCSEGVYMVYGKVLSLRVLPDGFSSDDAAFLKVPLWVKFPSLPQKTYGHNFFRCELLIPPMVDVGLEPAVVPNHDAREDVLVEVLHREAAGFVRDGLSYSEAVFSNLDPVGDSDGANSDEAEESKEELGPEAGVSDEEVERDEFIEVWVSFLDIPLEFTHRPLISHVLSIVGDPIKGAKQMRRPHFLRVWIRIDVREEPIKEYRVTLPRGDSYIQRVDFDL
ncbi:hypothetical protein LIER_41539 [Lithospermum erythrorhizon]|uniref:DUF4283 domain-containing protein n=1 Tax=Lithospermum erythrorhizon TaxID=34254 RepID=A0AAV3REU3_LITER